MAEYTQATTSNLTPKVVVPGVLAVEMRKKSYFARFKGESKESIIQIVPAIRKEAGDQVTVALAKKITGDGVTGDATLEGNEVAMTFKNMQVKVDQRRQATKLAGKMTEKRSAIKLRKEAVERLATWGAEVDDEELFYHLSCARGVRAGTLSLAYAGGPNAFATPDTDHHLFAGGTTLATITATDKLTCEDIDMLVEQADLLDTPIQPVPVEGGKYFVLVISPEQARNLRQDPTWKEAQKDANIRGLNNPIFTGALQAA